MLSILDFGCKLFYLMTHSTHFIFTVIQCKTYGKGTLRQGEWKPAATTWATLSKKQGFFYMHHPTDRVTHTTAFVTPVMEHWLE